MTDPKFQRRIENFTCEHCGTQVVGNGFTNHCPQCLYSKHVDVHPGDRAAECGGMMPAIRVEGSTGKGYFLIQKCEKCGHERRNAVVAEDNMDVVIALAERVGRV
jgi:hypothetical protein